MRGSKFVEEWMWTYYLVEESLSAVSLFIYYVLTFNMLC